MSGQALPCLVVGGGIGGVGAALALAGRGAATLVLEQAPEIGEIGAGIQLGPNALRVLDDLGVLETVYDAAVFPPAATMRDATTAKVLTRLAFDATFRERFGYPYVVTHRSDLHLSLVEAAEATGLVEIRSNARVTNIRERGDEVVVALASGEEIRACTVVGADGLHSVVRQYVAGADELRHIGDVAYRGTVPYDHILDRPGKDDMTWWVGPGMHLIQYPLRRKELFNQVAVFTSECLGPPDEWGPPTELDRRFADKHDFVTQGLELINRDRRWTMVDRPPASTWTRGRVTLLGDAAHPMVQYLAQGGCQALEDAWALAASIRAPGNLRTGAPEAFLTYQKARAPRATTIQLWARAMGEIVHADGLAAALRNELFSLRESKDLAQVQWLYGT